MRLHVFISVLLGFSFTFLSCERRRAKQAFKDLQAQAEAIQLPDDYEFPCLDDSITNLLKTEHVPEGQLSLPIGDSIAFFYDFPKKWQNEIGYTNPKAKKDALSDSMLSRLALHPTSHAGLIFETDCYKAYLITNEDEQAYWRQVGLVTVTKDNKLIDSLTCRSTYEFNSENKTYQRFFYITEDSIIHTKTVGCSNATKTCRFGGHDEFKILNNGVIAPYHEVDFSSEFVEKGILGNRVLKGKTIKGLPHGPWEITELDLTLPYPTKNLHYIDYTYSIGEGYFHHGAKVGNWTYYKMRSDTFIDRDAYTYSYPTYEKSTKILKTERYAQGVLIEQEFKYDSSKFRGITGNFVNMPYRYTNHLYKSIKGKAYYINNIYGIYMRETMKGGNITKLKYGDELLVLNDAYNVTKDFYYYENILANNLRVENNGQKGFINIKYISPFPMPDSTDHKQLTLKEYAQKFPDYVTYSTADDTYTFLDCDISEAFLFLRNLKFSSGFFDWLEESPIVSFYENNALENVTIKSELVEGYEAPFSRDGKLYKLLEVNYYFKDGLPYCDAKFVLEGANVKLTFGSNSES